MFSLFLVFLCLMVRADDRDQTLYSDDSDFGIVKPFVKVWAIVQAHAADKLITDSITGARHSLISDFHQKVGSVVDRIPLLPDSCRNSINEATDACFLEPMLGVSTKSVEEGWNVGKAILFPELLEDGELPTHYRYNPDEKREQALLQNENQELAEKRPYAAFIPRPLRQTAYNSAMKIANRIVKTRARKHILEKLNFDQACIAANKKMNQRLSKDAPWVGKAGAAEIAKDYLQDYLEWRTQELTRSVLENAFGEFKKSVGKNYGVDYDKKKLKMWKDDEADDGPKDIDTSKRGAVAFRRNKVSKANRLKADDFYQYDAEDEEDMQKYEDTLREQYIKGYETGVRAEHRMQRMNV